MDRLVGCIVGILFVFIFYPLIGYWAIKVLFLPNLMLDPKTYLALLALGLFISQGSCGRRKDNDD